MADLVFSSREPMPMQHLLGEKGQQAILEWNLIREVVESDAWKGVAEVRRRSAASYRACMGFVEREDALRARQAEIKALRVVDEIVDEREALARSAAKHREDTPERVATAEFTEGQARVAIEQAARVEEMMKKPGWMMLCNLLSARAWAYHSQLQDASLSESICLKAQIRGLGKVFLVFDELLALGDDARAWLIAKAQEDRLKESPDG